MRVELVWVAMFLFDAVNGYVILQREAATTQRLSSAIHLSPSSHLLSDLCVAGALGFGFDPLVETVYNHSRLYDDSNHNNKNKQSNAKETFVYGAADSVSVAARVYGLVLLLDAAIVHFGWQDKLPISLDDHPRQVALQVALSVWGVLTVSTVKRLFFLQSVSGTKLGRVKLYDQLLDFLLANIALVMICDELSIDIGMGLQSVFAAGGVGALIFSLASKDLAEQIVGGFAIQAWGAFDQGDEVRLGDGTEGTIAKIGLVETEIKGYDNIVLRIPNSQLFNQRVSNLSRIQQSRVQQKLRFKYSDLKKLDDRVLDDIVQEIKMACPKSIIDGSKPFNALISAYEPDHIAVTVNCHFDIPPTSGEYFTNRQEVLLAIARAVEKNDAHFALPSISYRTEKDLGSNDMWTSP